MIVGIAAAVAALALSFLAGGLYYVRRKRTKPSPVEPGTGLPADFMSINALHQGMASARDNGGYLNLPPNPERLYSNLGDFSPPKDGEHYSQVSLGELNAEAEQQLQAEREKAQEHVEASAPAKGPYSILPQANERGHYSELPNQVPTSSSIDNNGVSLAQLNKIMSQT